MKEIIKSKLKEIEEKENVTIICAVESGSRAWGFASEDSDYDVRFIYKRPLEDYMCINEKRDVIEWQLDDVYDINGWDIKKALQLLYKSNPTVFEWCHSPIIYLAHDDFKVLKSLLPQYFSKKKILKHYLSMAKRTYKEYLLDDQVKMKKYFYALRPIFAAKWIIERNEFPPIEFEQLLALCPDELLEKIKKMVDIKKTLNETDLYHKDEILNQYIEKCIDEYDDYADHLNHDLYDIELLNDAFKKMINIDENK